MRRPPTSMPSCDSSRTSRSCVSLSRRGDDPDTPARACIVPDAQGRKLVRTATRAGSKTEYPPSADPQRFGLRLLEHTVHAVALRRVQDAAVPDPEGDVVGDLLAVRDEIARARLVDGGAGILLLVAVAWDELPGRAKAHVHETRAIDAALRHAAPEIGNAEQRSCVVERL